jgi:hypothetical protein
MAGEICWNRGGIEFGRAADSVPQPYLPVLHTLDSWEYGKLLDLYDCSETNLRKICERQEDFNQGCRESIFQP